MDRKHKNLYLGLVALPSTGKGTVVNILESEGFQSFVVSDELRRIADAYKIPQERKYLSLLADSLRHEYGPSVLAAIALQKLIDSGVECGIVDGVRNSEEVKFLKENGVYMVGIQVDPEIRLERMHERGRTGDPQNLQELHELDQRENGALSIEPMGPYAEWQENPTRNNVQSCLALADQIITNNGTEAELRAQIDGVIAKRRMDLEGQLHNPELSRR